MILKVNTIFFSPTNTTAKVCKQIAKAISSNTLQYDISLKSQRKKYKDISFNADDLLIIGLPVYAGRIPLFLENYLKNIQGNNTPVVLIAVYGNRDYNDALFEMKNIFSTNGFTVIAAGAFIGEHSYTNKVATNRPDAYDLNIAFDFGSKIKELLNNDYYGKELIIKGNFPYRERKEVPLAIPVTDELCNSCGLCAENCPTEAIDFMDFSLINPEECIHCHNCVKNCPHNAKSFDNESIVNVKNRLIDNFSKERKEPELFIID